MGKQYSQRDFDQVVYRDNQEPISIERSNDEVAGVYRKQNPPEQKAAYRAGYEPPNAANGNTKKMIDISLRPKRSKEEEAARIESIISQIEKCLAAKKNRKTKAKGKNQNNQIEM